MTRRLRSILSAGALVAASFALAPVAKAAPAAGCADIEVLFARGTGEAQGLGYVGTPFVSATVSALPGRTVRSYAVVYAASSDQSSVGAGATDMSRHLQATAASCPNTRFVLSGYSQGASVTDNAIGIRFNASNVETVPAALAPRVVAVVVFGNPLGLWGGRTIATASATYGSRSKDYCNTNDSVCGSQPKTGSGDHLSYCRNGSTTAAAQFVAARLS